MIFQSIFPPVKTQKTLCYSAKFAFLPFLAKMQIYAESDFLLFLHKKRKPNRIPAPLRCATPDLASIASGVAPWRRRNKITFLQERAKKRFFWNDKNLAGGKWVDFYFFFAGTAGVTTGTGAGVKPGTTEPSSSDVVPTVLLASGIKFSCF